MARKFTIFAFFYFVFEGKFQVQAPRGAYIRRGDLTEGFLRYDFKGAYIWRGLYMEGRIFGILRYLGYMRFEILYLQNGISCLLANDLGRIESTLDRLLFYQLVV